MSRCLLTLLLPTLATIHLIAAPTLTLNAPADTASGIGASTTLQLTVGNSSGSSTVTFYGRKTTPAVPGADFVVGTLPDTQYYSQNTGGNRAQLFHAQTQFYLDNRVALNLAFVSHMGDFVQDGDSIPTQWTVADGAMARIEHRVNSLSAFGIPWGGAPGNHDTSPIGDANGTSTYFNQYFGEARFADRSYYRGHYGATNNNNYQFFSASGLDFIVIHLTYRTGTPGTGEQEVLDWADALLKAHPHRRAIVTSHWVIGLGNTFEGPGQRIYDNLKDNPNLFLLLCGHIHGEARRSDVFDGRTVHSVLQDYQNRPNGGDGWLRYFIFSPANNTISARTYTPALNQSETDASSQFDLPYNMQGAITAWIPLGTVTTGNGPASLSWIGLERGSRYEWYASATDSLASTTSTTRRFTTAAALPPVVTLDVPFDATTHTSINSINLSATATDPDGTVAKVIFFAGATRLGEDTTGPTFTFAWNAAPDGGHVLSAVAIDNSGLGTLSNRVNITVTPPAITGPVLFFENFNSMGTTGTTPPTGWTMKTLAGSASTWTGTTIPGTGPNSVASMVNTSAPLTAASAPTTTNVNGYNAGTIASASVRTIATSPTGITGNAIQRALTNPVGIPLTHLAISYEIHRFNVAPAANELPGFQLFVSQDDGTTWTNVLALNPTLSGPGGVIVPNSIGVTAIAPTVFALPSSWAPGASLLLRWVDDNANGSADQVIGLDNVTLSVAGLAPLHVWKFNHFSNASIDSNDDTDGDGMTALYEYATGGDPTAPGTTGQPDTSIASVAGDTYLTLTFMRHPSRTDIRYIVEATSDLANWQELARADFGAPITPIAPATAAHVSGEIAGTYPRPVTVRDTLPLSGTTARFIRLRITD